MKTVKAFLKSLCVFTFLGVVPVAFGAVPVVNGFSPTSGSAGTLVTITGANFGASPTNDIVYFGPVHATITSASSSNIVVAVPNGAMYAPITVTVGGLVAYSITPFKPTFSGTGAAFDGTSFAPRVDLAAPSGPSRVAIADLNGDGKPDLVVASIYAHELTILENISSSGSLDTNSFAAPVYVPFVNTASSPYWVVAGDLDGDGKIDLIAPDEAGNRILIYRNISSGGPLTTNSFAAPVAFNVGMSPRNIAIRDLDGDGRPDLAIANIGDQTVSILKNIGVPGVIDTNTFAPQFVLQAGSQPHDLTIGDLDGDGKPDLAVNNYTSPFVSLFRNVSSPGVLDTNSFEAQVQLPAPLYCNTVVMGDLDGDGKQDILIGTAYNGEVSIYRNMATPGPLSTNSFSSELAFPAAGWVSTVAVGDLNGDGKLDVALANQMDSTFSVFQNVGTGSFDSGSLAGRVDYVSGSNPYGVSIVDLDGDGRPDVVFGNCYSSSLSIYRNLNGNGTAPIIVSQPTNRTAAIGSTVTFSVEAVGTAPLSYQWWKPAGKILNATNSSLTLVNVQTNDAGPYMVVVTNLYGSAMSSNAVLTFNSATSYTAPSIVSQPINQAASVGGSVTFSVTAAGSPTLFYQWYFGGNRIPGALSHTLTLSNVQPSNAGSYFVLVSNLYGFATSSNAVLTVSNVAGTCVPPSPGLVAWWPAEGNGNDVVNGNTAILESGVTFGAGKVGQAFELQNLTNAFMHMPASPSLNVGAGSGLTVEGWINVSSVAGFHPIAEWHGGDRSSIGVQFWLNANPSQSGALLGALPDTNGNQHTLVSPEGVLAPNVFQHVALTYDRASGMGILYVNGAAVAQANLGSFVPQTTYDLWIGHRLFDVPEDWTYQSYLGGTLDELSIYSRALAGGEIAAIYNAGSSGKCPSASGTAPVITSQPTNRTVMVGGTATFSVTATGSPSLYYQWYHGGSLVSGATNSTLTLANIQSGDAGTYVALVTNQYGFATSSNAMLTVSNGSGSCVPPAPGLVAWWPAEGNGNDVVNGNTAILEGGVTFGAGKVGQAFEMQNPTNAFMHVPASPSLNVGAGSGLTVEGWINVSSVAGFHPIAEWRGGDPSSFGVQFWVNANPSQSGALLGVFPDTNGNQHTLVSPEGVLAPNVFQHVALTYDRASGMGTLYVNGAAVAQANLGSFVPQTTYDLWIGHRLFDVPGDSTYQSYLGGTLDELSIYSRALTAGEIAAIYNAGSSGKCPSASGTVPVITSQPTNRTVMVGGTATFSVTATGSPTLYYQWYFGGGTFISSSTNPTLTLSNVQPSNAGNYFVIVTNQYGSAMSSNAVLTVTNVAGTCVSPAAGLVAWWLGEGSANDLVNGNDGMAGPTMAYAAAEVGAGFSFNGVDYGDDYIAIPASPSLDVGTSDGFTIEGWINVGYINPDGGAPIIEWDSPGADGLQLWVESPGGKLYANIKDTSGNNHQIQEDVGSITLNTFKHVALTYDKASGMAYLYVNGVEVKSDNFGNITPQTAFPVNIGARTLSGWGSRFNQGIIDELSLYRRALSQSEIAAIYNAGSSGKCDPLPSAPIITLQPTNRTVMVGGTATFSVVATGTAPLHYQWSGPAGIISGATNSLLTLSNVQPTNAGNYHVLVSNAYGSTNSSDAVLTVNFGIAAIRVVNTTAPGGSSVEVPVTILANGNENALSFSLSFDPTRLVYSDVSLGSGATNGLILPNVSQAGSGKIGIELALPSGETFNVGTQELVRVTFNTPVLTGTQPIATAVGFTSLPISKLLSDVLGHALPATYVNGTVTLTASPLEGDAAPLPVGNGSIDLFDWVQIGRFVAGLDPITNGAEFQKVDCAPRDTLGDGQLKVTDWVQAGRYAAGLDPLTVAGGPAGPVTAMIAKAQSNGSNTRQVAVSGGSAVKGLTVTLPVTLEAQGDETALAFSLNFDPKVLRYVGAVKGSDASSAVLNVNSNQAGSGQLAIVLGLPAGGSHFTVGKKEIAKVSFVAIASATNNSVGFADQPVPRSISDVNATELTAGYVANSVVINPQPQIKMSVNASSSALSWPVWAGDFGLQAAGSLTPPINWTNVPVTLQTNGDNIEITLPAGGQQTFFRLYHP